MKKLFSIIGFAAALIACQPESLTTSFKKEPANVSLNISLRDINQPDLVLPENGITVSTTDYTLVPANAVKSDNTFSFLIKDGESEAISKKEATFSLTWKYKNSDGKEYTWSGTRKLNVQAALAGAEQTYNVIWYIGYSADLEGYELIDVPEYTKEEEVCYYMERNDSHAPHYHSDVPYFYNNSEFVLCAPVTFSLFDGLVEEETEGIMVDSEITMEDGQDKYKEAVEEMRDYYLSREAETVTKEKLISAWSMYNFQQKGVKKIGVVNVWLVNAKPETERRDIKVGSFAATYYNLAFSQIEQAIPGMEGVYHKHSGHYDPSHSHGPEAQNAGGGIAWAD